jgi:hypothetical protein
MNRPYIGGMHRKISVGSRGTTTYFGKRSGPNPRLLALGSGLVNVFLRCPTSG